ncbi:MAG: Grx4 family monothiol glutaredoxin [Gammaproteobacteria bacterium]|nr:Grx4 family monothiol glutaredoxin [Gammaproteobacteria bacterium]MCY4219907.1 Grx4 family monothiol glutaredoxin [Gammaproteobacteria bacterium]MCY4274017.1 Grx4 family monothiol glutaredoxin [Gammaproteobacteria bacterium]
MSIEEQLREVIENNEIILFMKGTPEFPQCGFSGRTAQILEACGVPYASVNVLADDAVREGIKQYSNWPTVPQLYIRGEFIGGCDIMMEMYENGELEKLLNVSKSETESAEQ